MLRTLSIDQFQLLYPRRLAKRLNQTAHSPTRLLWSRKPLRSCSRQLDGHMTYRPAPRLSITSPTSRRTSSSSASNSGPALLETDALGHLVTLNEDGGPQVTCVWVGLDGEDLSTAHLNPDQRKLDNVRRDPRVAISLEGTVVPTPGPEAVSGRPRPSLHRGGRRSREAPGLAAPGSPHPHRGRTGGRDRAVG